MKKTLSIILAAILILTSVGCRQSQDIIQTPVSVYYRCDTVSYNNASGVITPEIRDFAGYEQDLIGFLNLYLNGPITDGYTSPFPGDVQVESLEFDDTLVYIVLSEPFASLTGLDLTVACACLSKTLESLTNCESVKILAEGVSLNGSTSITMNVQNLLFLDNSSPDQK